MEGKSALVMGCSLKSQKMLGNAFSHCPWYWAHEIAGCADRSQAPAPLSLFFLDFVARPPDEIHTILLELKKWGRVVGFTPDKNHLNRIFSGNKILDPEIFWRAALGRNFLWTDFKNFQKNHQSFEKKSGCMVPQGE